MAEIPDALLAEYQGAHKLLDAVLRNPKTKEKAQEIIKDLNPNAVLPDYDLRKAVQGDVKALTDKIAGLEKQLKDEKDDAIFNRAFDTAMSKRGITEEGRPKVMELMKERKIYDPDAGALAFLDANPPPSPVQPSGWAGSLMFDTGKDSELASWFDETDKRVDQEIGAWLAERR